VTHQLAGIALAPLLYLQGKAVRRSVPALPEPAGPREGRKGEGGRLRILVLGDSAAAGVGVSTIDESLTGQLVDCLSASYVVEWQLVAKTGATTSSTLKHLNKSRLGPYDVCVTSLGVNDVTSGLGINAWLVQQRSLRQQLRRDLGVAHLIISGLPPMHGFPALPQPLRWWLGARATAYDEHLQKDLRGEADVSFLSLRFTDDVRGMAADGFHPGPTVYREWAKRVATLVQPSDHRLGQDAAT
jgi:lysophospholipase L1-like esterase